ncbi:hypothetical protein EC973_007891 [Apophysomyces ossiformis]|uniref:Wax synthase domain-containing protein n=1 Tax=Apophysomyces ossiformis TaxID=679940 RepID=A0A8H7EQN4_9FUNG|nr:hypothetical protein EC973_007891 [Apophysomyces ossiformis]
MEYLYYAGGGEDRVLLHPAIYTCAFATPAAILGFIITRQVIPPGMKQCLSIPLLLADILVPWYLTSNNKVLDLIGGITTFNIFLRFLEFYWVGPILQGRPVYTSVHQLHIDFWSCMRTFPKADKETGEIQRFIKDKKFYHLLPTLMYHMAVTDVFGTYYATFTAQDIAQMQKERRLQFFLFFALAVFVLNSAFNVFGTALQLFYVIVYEGGAYASEQWRPLMADPIVSNSLDELWSRRWHQLLRSTWLAMPFRPVRLLGQRWLAKKTRNPLPLAVMMASLSVFAISGLMHEYLILCNVGWTMYSGFFIGQQQLFFSIHGMCVAIEKIIYKASRRTFPLSYLHGVFVTQVLQRLWVVAIGYYLFPQFLTGFVHWGVHLDNPFQVWRPFVLDALHQVSHARDFCGSLF